MTVKSRKVVVKGPRGKLVRNFPQAVKISIQNNEVVIEKYFGNKKEAAAVRTVMSHIRNMCTGVTKGFKAHLRLVYAHFPITATIENGGKQVQLRNFLGEKEVRTIDLKDGVSVRQEEDARDEIILEGNSPDAVYQSAADIQQSCQVRGGKDMRKYLDGVYVSLKSTILDE